MILCGHSIFFSQSISKEIGQFSVLSLEKALVHVSKIIEEFPSKDALAIQAYEKNKSYMLVRCAKVLYDNARQQILLALQEIENCRLYWQYQKDHEWQYFFSKSPVKWVTGSKQIEEIEDNLELLESKQGELYVLLGLLAEAGNVYEQNYKNLFLKNVEEGLRWVDKLLDLLSSIKIRWDQSLQENLAFVLKAIRLKLQLQRVSYFKDDILLEIKSAAIPTGIEQNWLKYGALMLGAGVGYNYGAIEQLKNSLNSITGQAGEYIVEPVQKIMKDVFAPEQKKDKELFVSEGDLLQAEQSIKDFIARVSKKDLENVIDVSTGKVDRAKFQKLSDQLMAQRLGKFGKGVESSALYYKLWFLQSANHMQDFLDNIQKQYAGVGKIAFLTPTVFAGWLGYSAYQKLFEKNYEPLRRALLDINSLFVDQSKPLDDERYGKMVYLLYNLKKQAQKDITQKNNLQKDFLKDLENIESKEFDIAAKRRIIEDMFRKYTFLSVR